MSAGHVTAAESRPEILLDLGAGDGIAMPFLQPVADRVIGLNYGHGRSKEFHGTYPDESILTADGRDLPLRDASIDVVVSLETIYILPTLEDQQRCLGEIRRVLKQNGLFVCSVPIEIGLPAVIKYTGRRCARINTRIGFRDMLKHWLHPLFDLTSSPCGDHPGFNAYHFARRLGDCFRTLRKIRLPLWYPFCTTLLLVCRPRQGL